MVSKLISTVERYWVWIGEGIAVAVETEQEVIAMLQASGREYKQVNMVGRYDHACLVAELTFDRPLPIGKHYHGTIFSPVLIVKYEGTVRKCIQPLAPSRLSLIREGWWLEKYRKAIDDCDVMRVRGNRLVEHPAIAMKTGMHILVNSPAHSGIL